MNENRRAVIDHAKCVDCGRCIGTCNCDAIEAQFDQTGEIMNAKVAEYTAAVVNGRPHFHVSW